MPFLPLFALLNDKVQITQQTRSIRHLISNIRILILHRGEEGEYKQPELFSDEYESYEIVEVEMKYDI